MPAFASSTPGAGIRAYTNQRRAFQWTLRATFLFFLAATTLRRLGQSLALLPRSREPKLSLFAEARASAAAVIPFIFMG